MKVYINAKIITMDGEKVIPNGALLVDGSKITAVLTMGEYSARSGEFAGAEAVDCAGKVIMPGLINAHTHITLWRSFGDITLARDVATETMLAVRNSLNCLRKGVTTVRDMGHKDHVHNEMKLCAERGVILAPRFRCANAIIEMSNGHASHFCTTVSTPQEMVSEIRRQVNAGTDFIKIVASHDDLYHLDKLSYPWFSQKDLDLLVAASHELDAKVSAHANGVETIQRCLNAGMDCIEHGIGITAEQAAQMREQGTWLVPTLTGYMENGLPNWRRGDKWVARYHQFWELHEKTFPEAVKAKVKIAAGTDTLGDLNEEIALMHRFGMTTHEALEAATINAARLMELDTQIGSLERGKLADFIVLRSDPLADLSALYNIDAISLDGRFIPTSAIDAVVPPCDMWAKNW